jgi:hypothetical protein
MTNRRSKSWLEQTPTLTKAVTKTHKHKELNSLTVAALADKKVISERHVDCLNWEWAPSVGVSYLILRSRGIVGCSRLN